MVADDWQRRRVGKRMLYRVDIQNVDADALFVAGTPEFLNVGATRVSRSATGALRFGFVPAETVRYEVYSFLAPTSLPAEPRRIALTAAEREQDLKLPEIDPRIPQLARQMTQGAHDDAARARSIEEHLRHDYGYSLDLPSEEPRDPVANFLFTRRTGYCEYFASAMTVMLRTLGIPTRLVNGFQSGIANPYSGTLVIRASDAHTWVEAFLPLTGWTVFDPTPLTGRIPTQTMWTKLSLYVDAADTFWRDWVLSYDLGQQLTLASRVESTARHIQRNGFLESFQWIMAEAKTGWRVLRERAGSLGAIALGFIVGAVLFRQLKKVIPTRRARLGKSAPKDATILYTQLLEIMKRRGYQKPAWFTAQEFARSVRTEEFEELDRFTKAYYSVRFGGNAEHSRDMAALLERLSH
jgi:transglutaminase-like putative cysteine protease